MAPAPAPRRTDRPATPPSGASTTLARPSSFSMNSTIGTYTVCSGQMPPRANRAHPRAMRIVRDFADRATPRVLLGGLVGYAPCRPWNRAPGIPSAGSALPSTASTASTRWSAKAASASSTVGTTSASARRSRSSACASRPRWPRTSASASSKASWRRGGCCTGCRARRRASCRRWTWAARYRQVACGRRTWCWSGWKDSPWRTSWRSAASAALVAAR